MPAYHILYLSDIAPGYRLSERPMAWHTAGLTWTASGYGARIPSRYVLDWPEHPEKGSRRIYLTHYSNIGSAWVIYNSKRTYLRDTDSPEV